MNNRKLSLYKNIEFLIKVESGPDTGEKYRVHPPHVFLGRDPSCQIVLSDPKVSRKQCMIKFGDEILCVDISSRKTTKVNGRPGDNQSLKPGDIISFGNSSMRFLTRSKEQARLQLVGQAKANQGQKGQNSKRRFFMILFIIVLVAAGLFLSETEPTGTKKERLITQEDVQNQIEESRERSDLLKESYDKKRKLSQKKYLHRVEKHFISGFRDFQNGQYGRAIDSFGTTIASDQTHDKAKQYSKIARRKKENLIEIHISDGTKYMEKMMYNRCAAEFEKAIILINNTNSKKYQLAKTKLHECRLLKQGGY